MVVKKQQPDYEKYEAEKRKIQELNLSPVQYQSAIKRLAQQCGV